MKKKENKKLYKYKLNLISGNIIASIILILFLILLYFTFDNYYFKFGYKEVLIMLSWFVLHELLHYIGYLINKDVKNKDISLGICLEKGVMYTRCTTEINKKSVIISLLTPFTLIGIITLIISYIIDSPFLAFLSVSNIAGSYFDLITFYQLLKLPKDIKFSEYDECDSYYIISNKDISNIKTLGINLIDTKEYTEYKNKNTKKIEISKLSIIIIIILIALSFVF